MVGIVQDAGATEAVQQPGFMGAILMSNASTDEVVALTFWKTEAELAASENTDKFTQRIAKVAHLLTSPRMVEHFDVEFRLGQIFDG